MQRREFITLLERRSDNLAARRARAAVEYRFVDDQQEQLRAIVTELMHRQIAVIVGNTPPATAAKSASSTVPIVFVTGGDPVELGLVRSFNRPGGNATGVSFLTVALEAKRQGLLRELLPQARAIAALVDPNAPDSATQLKNVQDAARTFDREIQIVQASTASQLDNGFAILASQRADALSRPLDPQGAGEHQPIRLRVRLSLRAGYSGDREVVVWCRRPDVTGATMPPLRSFRPRQAIQVRTSSAQRRSLADSDV